MAGFLEMEQAYRLFGAKLGQGGKFALFGTAGACLPIAGSPKFLPYAREADFLEGRGLLSAEG